MAITMDIVRQLNAVTLYSEKDDAIDHEATDWEEFRKNPLREDLIIIAEGKEPTKFICNFDHKGKVATMLDDAKFGGVDKNTQTPKVNYTKWAYEVVKHSLKGIQNPPNVANVIKYKKTGANEVADDVMTMLKATGIMEELFSYYLVLKNPDAEEKVAAKN